MNEYWCSVRNILVDNHSPEECVFCLRRMRDCWKQEASTNHLEELKILRLRVTVQRHELARLNAKVDTMQAESNRPKEEKKNVEGEAGASSSSTR